MSWQKIVKLSDLGELSKRLETLPEEYAWKMPILRGNKTATHYHSFIENFSTVTEIFKTVSGQEYFLVHYYSFAWVHRLLDFFMKYMTKTETYKVFSAQKWQAQFARKSQITIIPLMDNDTVVMPYIPNLNLFDLIINGPQIEDFGECEWGRTLTQEQAYLLLEKAMRQLAKIHKKIGAWGEVIIQNMIVDPNKKVYICDPEVKYYDSVEPITQLAHDLYDFLVNTCSVMNIRFKASFEVTAARLLMAYEHEDILKIMKALDKLCSQPLSWSEKLFFGYTKVRLALTDMDQYQAIRNCLSQTLQAYK